MNSGFCMGNEETAGKEGAGGGGGEGVGVSCTLLNIRLCMVPPGNPHSCASPDSEQRHDCDEEEVQQVA